MARAGAAGATPVARAAVALVAGVEAMVAVGARVVAMEVLKALAGVWAVTGA